jgi:hypothetical protein
MKKTNIFKKIFDLIVGLAFTFIFSLISIININAQSTLVWTGTVSSDANNIANWNPQTAIDGNILLDTTKDVTNWPVIGGNTDQTINSFSICRTCTLTVAKEENKSLTYSSSGSYYHVGVLNVNSGKLYTSKNKNFYLEDTLSIVNISGSGTLIVQGTLLMGKNNSPLGGYINISGNGTLIMPASVARFATDSTRSVITITDNGKFTMPNNQVSWFTTLVKKAQIKTSADKDVVIQYDEGTNITTVYARDKMAFVVEPDKRLNLVANQAGSLLTLAKNDGWASMQSFRWKYSTTSGSGYIDFPAPETNDTIYPKFPSSGLFYLVCVGNNGTNDVISNEIIVVVASDKVTISPNGKQKIKSNQISYPLTVTETATATSREWKYSTTPGSGFISFATAQSGLICAPVFPAAGTYYVRCESVIGGKSEISNEVEIEFLDNTNSFDIQWKGTYSNEASDAKNWFPIAYIYRNNLIVDTNGIKINNRIPEFTNAANDTISGIDIRPGAKIILNKPDSNIVYRSGDQYLTGELIINSGHIRFSGRLRLESNDAKITMNGGKLTMGTDFIVGANNSTTGAEYIRISGNSILDAASTIWRFSLDSTRSVITISDSAKLLVRANWVTNALTYIKKGQIRAAAGKKLWSIYDTIQNITFFYARDSFDMEITPYGLKYQGVKMAGDPINAIQTEGITAFEWKYSTKAFKDWKDTSSLVYKSFTPSITASECIPAFDSAGIYYVVCEGTKSNGTKVMSNHAQIVVVKADIAPSDTQYIEPTTNGTQLTVTSTQIADKWEWKYSTVSGSDYQSMIPSAIEGISYTPFFTTEGVYYVVCEGNFKGKIIYSNEVVIKVAKMGVTITNAAKQNLAVGQSGTPLVISESKPASSREWKYSTATGGPYQSFTPSQTGSTYTPLFNEAGKYFVVCESKIDDSTYTSNEVSIEVKLVTVTIQNPDKQTIKANTNGSPIKVVESVTASSREWKYSTTSGSGYQSFNPKQSGSTYTPRFATAGTYYVICESTIYGKVYTTTEVQIEVTPGDAIENNFMSEIFVYPNPSKGTFFISTNNFLNASVQIIDMQGRIIKNENYNTSETLQITIPEKGMYIVKIINGNNVSVSRILIQ